MKKKRFFVTRSLRLWNHLKICALSPPKAGSIYLFLNGFHKCRHTINTISSYLYSYSFFSFDSFFFLKFRGRNDTVFDLVFIWFRFVIVGSSICTFLREKINCCSIDTIQSKWFVISTKMKLRITLNWSINTVQFLNGNLFIFSCFAFFPSRHESQEYKYIHSHARLHDTRTKMIAAEKKYDEMSIAGLSY